MRLELVEKTYIIWYPYTDSNFVFWGHCALLELSSSRDWILDCMSIISSLSVKIVVTSFWQWNHNLSHLKETNNIRKSSIMQSIKQPLGSQSHCNINLTHQGRISLMFLDVVSHLFWNKNCFLLFVLLWASVGVYVKFIFGFLIPKNMASFEGFCLTTS